MSRSTSSCTSGLPLISVESTSTASGIVFIFARILSEYSVELCDVGAGRSGTGRSRFENRRPRMPAPAERRFAVRAETVLAARERQPSSFPAILAVSSMSANFDVDRAGIYDLLLAAADRCERVGHAGQSCGSRTRSAQISAKLLARLDPSGARTEISNCDWSSTGKKFLPTNMNSGTMLKKTRAQSVTITHRCAIENRSSHA